MPSNQNKPETIEVVLVVFLTLVVIVAVLTILGPQIETLVHSLTGR